MLGDIRDRAAVLAAQGEPLDQPEDEQDHRSEHTDLRIRGNEPDQGRGETHTREGNQECVLAADFVADPAKD